MCPPSLADLPADEQIGHPHPEAVERAGRTVDPDPRRRLDRVVDEAPNGPRKATAPIEHPRPDPLVHQRHREDIGRSERQGARRIARVPEEEERVSLGEREGELVMACDVPEGQQEEPDVALGAPVERAPPRRRGRCFAAAAAPPSDGRCCRW